MSTTITFKPKQVTKKIMSDLQDRVHDVICKRYGLVDDAEKQTLESIGKKYGITRERVRQIENVALNSIRKSEAFKNEEITFKELKDIIISLGSLVSENNFLSHISNDKSIQNHIHFYLVLGDEFKKHKEDDHFKTRWSVDPIISDKIHNSLKKLYAELDDEEIISESEIIKQFLNNLEDISEQYKNEEIIKRWLGISKNIDRNQLGHWGKITSSSIRTRGIKDYAFLVMREHGSPMHFSEVAKEITKIFNRKTNSATCHNELIKDSRFVLVGRGLYALKEWGYKPGVVSEVIKEILKKEGPLTKEEIIDKVLKERYLKRNTILVNLQNSKKFKKNKKDLYTLV
ncbi:hypothetical protein A2995_02055 [Candidatus Nomurabacteria bacterium RIFCSPLOWO2_01_FULL_33_24]|uniref:HTH HARE-type domain-containing protein n=1 Tax=Candidatus Nomurabacteria bacterium RIFCSPLOWO2_01_FULL_33_24 TaxID=1801765 RepID=A0A1F6WZ47_9BACT|nr:MAG: hypothetical protein A2995_02055 [Candidatus Nomurabacteria bacterium RIFCSPLOWO2_01_FULL_33_24]